MSGQDSGYDPLDPFSNGTLIMSLIFNYWSKSVRMLWWDPEMLVCIINSIIF